MQRRQLIATATAVLSLCGLVHQAVYAQSEKPLKVLVGFPAGVSIDVLSRIIADKLKDELHRTVIVDNKGGAGGRVAAEQLKHAPADGNTVMVAPVVVPVLAPMVFSKLSYNAQTDFAPVVRLADFSFALAVPATSPVKTLQEYAQWIQKNPQKANFGSPAAGSLPHFFGIEIGNLLNVEMTHVPFNGGAALQSAVIGDHVPAGIDVVSEWQQNAKAKKITVLATSGATRSQALPDVPTFKEQGYADIEGQGWFAMYAPANTPVEKIDEINRAVNKVLAMPDVRERLLALGYEAGGGTAQDLGKRMEADTKRWGPIVKKTGFRVD